MKVFKDYAEVNEKIMEGYTVAASRYIWDQ